MSNQARGTVYLVGAGPGDPGLITSRGLRLLYEADAVVYDYLANPVLLESCRPQCRRIYVGKQSGNHTMTQEEINRLLVRLCSEGLSVVRLKGGDPFIFGRGGEEALELARSGCAFEVVPGVTAGIAAAAYAGIPLTHRGMAASATFVTGHEDPSKGDSDVSWAELGRSRTTLVFYMGVRNIHKITAALIEHGRSGSTPAAVIRWGSLPAQRTVTGTIADIAESAARAGVRPPAVLVVGEVVALRSELSWFDRRPLFGRRVLVTRSRADASALADALRRLGADVAELPAIVISPPESTSALDAACGRLGAFSWVVFTSVNAVEAVFDSLERIGRDARAFGPAQIAAVGTATAEVLAGRGVRADLVPEVHSAAGLAEVLRRRRLDVRDTEVFFPCSDIARETVPRELAALGARVLRVAAYRTVVPTSDSKDVAAALDPLPDLVTFTSSSTVTNLVQLLSDAGRRDIIAIVPGACIGPATADTARSAGFGVAVEAERHTIEGLVQAITEHATPEGEQ